ncbi:hypothetical protein [Bacillus alkalicola]|uniref:Uncharacterized protein n=1 Tax=Evansella alkalicola TaxID=745819 RepID=A0ABS6JW00_9BACI|nr:hypothetical protein [Bacillus alkalicola]MBU9722765.1 hypothetical protein [Bacillus alkalicola]
MSADKTIKKKVGNVRRLIVSGQKRKEKGLKCPQVERQRTKVKRKEVEMSAD